MVGTNSGKYSCCGHPAVRFDSTRTPNSQAGCRTRPHRLAHDSHDWKPRCMAAAAAATTSAQVSSRYHHTASSSAFALLSLLWDVLSSCSSSRICAAAAAFKLCSVMATNAASDAAA